ncbi:MAG: hypothetical protein V1745_03685 [Patescibacteria group bacterium]
MNVSWYRNPHRMSRIFAIGCIPIGLVATVVWSPSMYVFFPGLILYHAFDWCFSGAMGLPLAADMTDGQSDIAFYVYGPILFISYALSVGMWAGIGNWVGKALARRA